MAQFVIIYSLYYLSILYSSLLKSEAVVFPSSAHHLCHPEDALSLLQFKKDMLGINDSYASSTCDIDGQYSYPRMMTWNATSSDCCTWDGVMCHQITGHLIGLDLSCSRLMGIIHENSTLFHLSHLQKLSLARNGFQGNIPSNLSHLSKLVLLDLSDNLFLGFNPGDFQILLLNLTHIRVLSLHGVQIPNSSQANWSSSLAYLDLGYTGVDGKLSNSVFHLPLLQTLILSGNENLTFGLPKSNCLLDGIPDFICSFVSLKHLDLSFCGLSGSFTNSIGNLSQIVRFSLFANNFTGGISPIILNLPKLRELDLIYNLFSGQFPSFIGNLTELTMLGLEGNSLRGPLPSNISGLQKLRDLYLSYNEFDGTIPSWVFSLPSLRMLFLDNNHFKGQIKVFASKSLEKLNFGHNELDGRIPDSISQFVNLKFLDFGSNQLHGPVPDSISQLVNLEVLDFGYNQLDGQIPNSFFQLVNLKSLLFRDNQLDGPVPDSIFHLVNLSSLYLQSNNLSGSVEFKKFSHLKNLQDLDLSNNKLSLKIENKINVFFPNFSTLRLSSCGITEFPDFLKKSHNLGDLDLSNNKLHGQIPNWIDKDSIRFLNLSHNSLSSLGSLNTLSLMKNLELLDLGSNQFQEPLPLSICSLVQLSILDLSRNNFSGSIPKCFGDFSTQLKVMILAKNDLKGTVPRTFPKDSCQLLNLNLNGNSLEGPLPRSLANCKSFEILDFGNNKINDTFPTFFENLVELQVLILKCNRFFGSISNLKKVNIFPKLLVLDLSCNEFSGALPSELLKSFKAMITLDHKTETRASYMQTSDPRGSFYHYSMSFVMKGNVVELVKILTTLVVIDLSSNNFTGDIPETIGNLKLLIALNLSHNNLSGHMPSTLGKLYSLESLDLSWNQIEGEIPWQLADNTNLGFLNVSENHLRGRIPHGKQFNTFLNDSYYGNSELCGFPVSKDCGERDLPLPPSGGSYHDDEDSSFQSAFTWKSVLIGYGFGFAIGCLVMFTGKPKWLTRNIEEVYWYALLLLGKKKMYKQLMKKSRRTDHRHCRRNN